MQLPILLLPGSARLPALLLRATARGSLLLLALHHVPLLWPALYNAIGYEPLTPVQLERIVLVFFLLPELGARLVRRLCAVTARIEAGTLAIETRGAERERVRVAEIAAVEPWPLGLPWPGLRLRDRSGAPLAAPIALDDPAPLLLALAAAGAGAPAREALDHPAVRRASARASARSRLDHPLPKFALFALVPALPLFRLHQWVSFGGSFGEYHEFGLKAYLLGFGLYWLLSAIYLVLFAAGLRALGELVAGPLAWLLPHRERGVRRAVEIALRIAYYLTPPLLLGVRLALP